MPALPFLGALQTVRRVSRCLPIACDDPLCLFMETEDLSSPTQVESDLLQQLLDDMTDRQKAMAVN
jgi:hypothetical protein